MPICSIVRSRLIVIFEVPVAMVEEENMKGWVETEEDDASFDYGLENDAIANGDDCLVQDESKPTIVLMGLKRCECFATLE